MKENGNGGNWKKMHKNKHKRRKIATKKGKCEEEHMKREGNN